MKKPILLGLLCLSTSVLFAQFTLSSSMHQKVLGTWSLYKTVCCGPKVDPSAIFAAKTGIQQTLVFKNDTVLFDYKTGRDTESNKYHIYAVGDPGRPERYAFDHPNLYGGVYFVGDTLVLGNCATDGCDNFYVRSPNCLDKNNLMKAPHKKRKRRVKSN